MNRRKLIFVTNDDGYASAGFAAAVEVAQTLGDVIAVAPRTPQSGRSQAITLTEKLLLEKVRSDNGIEIYTLTGTPTDCVKVAFDYMLGDRQVDMVISGINHGSNSAINVIYSGTMGAAIEGSFYGIPSIGLSLTDHSPDADFSAAKAISQKVLATTEPDGRISFTMSGEYTNYEPEAEDTDEWALANGYVSVVPIQVDMTAYNRRPALENILNRCGGI